MGPFFKLCNIVATLATLATFTALAAFNAATFRANVRLATRNGAVMALSAAIFDALSFNLVLKKKKRK